MMSYYQTSSSNNAQQLLQDNDTSASNQQILSSILQPIIYIIKQSNYSEFENLILPTIRQILSVNYQPKTIQSIIILLENLDVIINKMKFEKLQINNASSSSSINGEENMESRILNHYFNSTPAAVPNVNASILLNNKQILLEDILIMEEKEADKDELLNYENNESEDNANNASGFEGSSANKNKNNYIYYKIPDILKFDIYPLIFSSLDSNTLQIQIASLLSINKITSKYFNINIIRNVILMKILMIYKKYFYPINNNSVGDSSSSPSTSSINTTTTTTTTTTNPITNANTNANASQTNISLKNEEIKLILLNILKSIETIIDKLDRNLIIENILPILYYNSNQNTGVGGGGSCSSSNKNDFIIKIIYQDSDINYKIFQIYRKMLDEQKKYGLSINILATRVMPNLIQQTINPNMNIEQFIFLIQLLQDMLNFIDRNQRNKLKLDNYCINNSKISSTLLLANNKDLFQDETQSGSFYQSSSAPSTSKFLTKNNSNDQIQSLQRQDSKQQSFKKRKESIVLKDEKLLLSSTQFQKQRPSIVDDFSHTEFQHHSENKFQKQQKIDEFENRKQKLHQHLSLQQDQPNKTFKDSIIRKNSMITDSAMMNSNACNPTGVGNYLHVNAMNYNKSSVSTPSSPLLQYNQQKEQIRRLSDNVLIPPKINIINCHQSGGQGNSQGNGSSSIIYNSTPSMINLNSASYSTPNFSSKENFSLFSSNMPSFGFANQAPSGNNSLLNPDNNSQQQSIRRRHSGNFIYPNSSGSGSGSYQATATPQQRSNSVSDNNISNIVAGGSATISNLINYKKSYNPNYYNNSGSSSINNSNPSLNNFHSGHESGGGGGSSSSGIKNPLNYINNKFDNLLLNVNYSGSGGGGGSGGHSNGSNSRDNFSFNNGFLPIRRHSAYSGKSQNVEKEDVTTPTSSISKSSSIRRRLNSFSLLINPSNNNLSRTIGFMNGSSFLPNNSSNSSFAPSSSFFNSNSSNNDFLLLSSNTPSFISATNSGCRSSGSLPDSSSLNNTNIENLQQQHLLSSSMNNLKLNNTQNKK